MPVVQFYAVTWGPITGIGIMGVLTGGLVIGLSKFSVRSFLPVFASAACAIANGLASVAFDNGLLLESTSPATPASVVMRLLQELGLTFYGLVVLREILPSGSPRRTIYQTIFALLILCALLGEIASIIYWSLALRQHTHPKHGNDSANYVHIAYLGALCLAQCWTTGFLLHNLRTSDQTSLALEKGHHHLLRRLARSTEFRVSFLCIAGVGRLITYAAQAAQSSTAGLSSDLYRFLYMIECMFPFLFMVDCFAEELQKSRENLDQLTNHGHSDPFSGKWPLEGDVSGSGTSQSQTDTTLYTGSHLRSQ